MKRNVRPQRQLSKKCHQLQQQKHSQQLRRLPLRQPQFIKDSIVEVTSKEEGFIGAWFTATILKLPSFRDRFPFTGKVYVEYKNLLSDEDPSKLLREYVKVDLVRPVPPAEDHRETFNVGDAVDAYYEDGWWTGTVTEIVEDSEFRVFFKNPPHEIVFCPSNLRIHRDWIKGSWVPPVNQTATGKMFSMGKKVEVCFDTGTSLDVWYPATVLEDKGNCTFFVECQQSDGNGGSKIRKKTVDSFHIRPVPPFPNSRNFLLLEKVDAFYDFGWWGGVITKELTGSRYVVFINHTKEDKEFAFSELRGHMEWKHGEWFTASQDASIPSYHRNNENGTLKIESNKGIALPLINSVSMKSSSQKKRAFSRRKEIELAMEILGNDKDPVFDSSLTSYEKSGHVASPDNVGVENGIFSQPLCADQSNVGHSSCKRGRTKRAKIVEKEENTHIGSKNTEESKTLVKKLQNAAKAGKEGNETEDVHDDCLTVDINLPIVVGLACDNTIIPRSKRSYRSNGEETVKRGSVWVNLDETKLNVVQLEEVNGSEKKRRGRPRKSSAEASILSMNGSVEATDGGVGGGSSNHQMKQEENQLDNIKSTTSPSSTGGENAIEASRKPRGKQLTKRGSKRKTNLMNLMSKVHDVPSPNTAEESYSINEEVSIEESPNNTFDNQPLAKWIENVDSSRSSLTRCNADARGDQMEIVKEGGAAVDEIRPVGIELQSLPFEKKSTLWSALESMEVFQKLPQKLHFQPLEHFKETVREGLAIGTMVTFTSVVEKTSKLQFNDTNESIDSILETLLELETHGFDVGVIRDRVSRLRRMKEKQEKVQEEVDKLKSEMTEHELEKSKIDEEIEEINKQIKELQEKLIGAKCMTVKKNGEIESLQLKLKGVEEGFGSIRCEFECQSPWP